MISQNKKIKILCLSVIIAILTSMINLSPGTNIVAAADTSVTIPVNIDASVRYSPDSGVGNTNFGDSTALWAGTYEAQLSFEDDEARRLFVRFDDIGSYIPANASINSAHVEFYSYYVANNSSFPLRTYQVTSSWLENNITWNNQPSVGNYISSTSVTGSDTWYACLLYTSPSPRD